MTRVAPKRPKAFVCVVPPFPEILSWELSQQVVVADQGPPRHADVRIWHNGIATGVGPLTTPC
jgi:hypothetical protein